MDRTSLVENIQHKIAKLENEEMLLELETMIDQMLFLEKEEELPVHVQDSISRATKELDGGKGIPHGEVWREIIAKYPKAE
jgi:hypothetical protein